ncbi:MAG: zinc ribbon domain-containing protein [Desulfotignum sp.]|nr:zinc ribbon domain-containing protein [Desulfotignum sp.]MCF8114446.1 zinc ribbon domain-containing protein [Desulfotignum sp.]MCF8125080.1 zinc ribbon domain-containing protein [Desulfotignum sp.]
MPIYEFKCLKCEEFFEVIVMGSQKDQAVACPKCQSPEFERVVSTTNYAMAGSSGQGAAKGVSAQERTCSGGSCKTYTVAGETRD